MYYTHYSTKRKTNIYPQKMILTNKKNENTKKKLPFSFYHHFFSVFSFLHKRFHSIKKFPLKFFLVPLFHLRIQYLCICISCTQPYILYIYNNLRENKFKKRNKKKTKRKSKFKNKKGISVIFQIILEYLLTHTQKKSQKEIFGTRISHLFSIYFIYLLKRFIFLLCFYCVPLRFFGLAFLQSIAINHEILRITEEV